MLQLMLPTARQIFKFSIALTFTFTLGSCSLFDQLPDRGKELVQKKTQQKVFLAPYDTVWRIAHTTLKYALAQTNQDTGVIETEFIKGVDGFLPPEAKAPSAGLRYKIFMTFAKGRTDGKESTRVTIEKKVEILKDFFTEPEVLPSDGLEEKLIFYRMERELVINDVLRKNGN